MEKDAITGNTEINFIDQNTNSLKQLNHYFDEIAKVEMAKKEREKSEMKTDSLTATSSHRHTGYSNSNNNL